MIFHGVALNKTSRCFGSQFLVARLPRGALRWVAPEAVDDDVGRRSNSWFSRRCLNGGLDGMNPRRSLACRQ